MSRRKTKALTLYTASCGHQTPEPRPFELCDACIAAIPKLRDEQAVPLALQRRFALLRRARRR